MCQKICLLLLLITVSFGAHVETSLGKGERNKTGKYVQDKVVTCSHNLFTSSDILLA